MRGWDGGWFTLGASASYPVLLWLDWAVVRYYPLTGRWSTGVLGPDAGPQMAWYGLMLAAAAIGISAMVVARLAGGTVAPARAVQGALLLGVLGCGFVLRGFFLP